jgi:nucleoside-diphosphate-sugar epimerase
VVAQALKGDVVRLGSLTPRRDLNFVTDTVNGMVLAATTPGIEGREINVGSGVSHSIGEVAQAIIDRVNPVARIEFDAERERPEKSEVMDLLADISLAEDLLGYRPQVGFEEGLDRVIEYMRALDELPDASRYVI